ncbi:MAG: hypothetical protein L6R35_003702 [Caloplaca aegaea]|nr:MAG: hypothetical protein L6R35_003702 [Caloplaca aegaea]
MAAAELDIPRLATFCSLPQTSLTSLLDAPTSDLVRTLLRHLSPRLSEQDELKSAKLKLNVELENAVRGGESKSRVLKNSVEKGLKEVAELRHKLQNTEQARATIESDLDALKSSTANSSSEVTSLKARVASLESSNRDTLALLESKSTSYDKLSEELTAQHQRTIDLRKEVSSLEQRVQSADAAVSTAAYHEQSLQSEIEQLKRNNDWLDRELKAKTDEYAKYRKDKGSRISDLQRQNDESANTIEAARRMEQTLRNRIEELSLKTEEYLTRIQKISEEAARTEESYKKSADSNRRLIELTQNASETDKARLEEVRDELEATRDNAQEEISRLVSELQTESDEKQAAEQRIADLEGQIEKLEADITRLRTTVEESRPLHDGTNGQPSTPGRANSPASSMFSPARSRLKGGPSMTQMYSENSELKSENAALRNEIERLSASVDEMLQDAEAMRPEIEEVRTEKARLEDNVADMTTLVDQMGRERDQAVKDARKAAGQNEARATENGLLRQQLRDLSTQIKILLFELDRREKGLDSFSADQQLQLEQLARGDTDAIDATDTDRFIAAELVMFRSIAELQEQNAKMLIVTRDLGGRMEREEAQRKQNDDKDYKKLYEACQDEITSLLTQSQSYVQERNMFRRMLTHRGQLSRDGDGDGDSTFGDSVNEGATPAASAQSKVLNSVEQSPQSKDIADYIKLIKELQVHFDNYREETRTDHKTLKEQADKLSTTNGELRAEVTGKNSQISMANERYQMLQSNFALLKNTNMELQKQSQFFSDNAAKQDLRTQQVAEDLVETKGLLDSMRNENANLRAEKEFFKTIEKRLTAENEAQFSEKVRLNNLNMSLQNLINEREQADGEARRRLQSRIESLEQELQTTKRILSEQTNEHKRTIDRRDYDQLQNQKKIDDLLASLGTAREELASLKTSCDHLQARVDELTAQLRTAEDRVQLLQPASSGRMANGTEGQTEQRDGETDEASLDEQQELAVEVADLKRELESVRRQLRDAKEQSDRYKGISQTSEEELQSLNEAQNLYRQEMDNVLEERNARILELEQRINDIHAEMSSTNTELTELRNKEAEIDRQLQEQKSSFEREIADLKDRDERHATAAQYHQEDLRAQAEIAQQAQQNYENELVKHAEAAKTLQKVRGDLNILKVQMVEMKTEVESARSNLRQSEESWLSSQARYEHELTAVREGKEKLAEQNDRLHEQLETLGAQISKLQTRPAAGESEPVEDQPVRPGLENVQEIMKYLRQEKQIVVYQLEASQQESKRLQQQLDHSRNEYHNAQLKLDQQQRVEQDMERSALNHNRLMDTINELNTFRESNVTLRTESRQSQAALAQKTRELEQLIAQVEPLKSEVRDLKNKVETQAGDTRLLQEDRDRWRQRTQDILQKYDRVDPAELEALKSQIQDLQTERDDLQAAKQSLQEKVDGIDSQIAQVQEQNKEKVEELRSRLTDQFKTRSKNLTGTIRDKEASLQAVTKEKQDLEQRIVGLEEELEKSNTEKDEANQNAATANSSALAAKAQDGSEDGQVDESEPSSSKQEDLQALQERLTAAETRVNEEAARNTDLQSTADTARSRLSELEEHIQEIQQKLDAANAELVRVQAEVRQKEDASASSAASAEDAEKLRRDLERVQQDADNLRAAASIQVPPSEVSGEEGGKSVTDQLSDMRAAIQAELDARHNERVAKSEEVFERRTQTMRNQLTKKLTDGKEQMRREKEEALEALRTAHEQELSDLNRRHEDELDELKQQEETKFAAFKTAWVQEQAPKTEAPKPSTQWEPTDAEAKHFVASNATVRAIVSRNISQKINETRTALVSQLNEEHAKELATKLEEAQTKAEAAREQAVVMEGKKNAVKVNILENKAKLAQMRLDIVSKAANDTPSKPVVEVWDVAKGAKPATSAPQQSITSPGSHGPSRTGRASQNISQNPSLQRTTNESPQMQAPTRTGFFGQPMPISTLQQPQTQSQKPSNPSEQAPVAQAETPAQDPASDSGNLMQTQPFTAPPQSSTESEQPVNPASTGQAPGPTTSSSDPPTRQQQQQQPPQGQATNHPNPGTAPAVSRVLHQSGLPVARGGSMNRGGRARGQEGRGRGRGAPQALHATSNESQHPAAASPTQLNGGAKQFVPPGNKRPREDGEGGGPAGGFGGNGKRLRGDGGGT